MKYFVLFGACGVAAKIFSATFSADIAPILKNDCLACHSAEKAKGGYRVHTFEAVLKPGKSDNPAVVPGSPDKSELYLRLITHDEDDRMPQDAEALSPAKIELFRQWIAEGAKLDRGEPQSDLSALIPRREHPAPPRFYPRALPILSLAFPAEGERLAVSGYHEITFWTLKGELAERITNAPQRVHSIAFQPGAQDSRFAVAGGTPGRSGELSVFAEGRLLTNLVHGSDAFLSVAFSSDGKLLACGGADNSIRVFRTENWEAITTIQQHADWVTSVSFDEKGGRIISASRDRTARIYDAESGELETTYNNHGAALFSATFVGADRAASGGKEKIIHLWNTSEGKKQNEVAGAGGEIFAMVAGEDCYFAASADGKVRQYAVKDRKLMRTYEGHGDAVYSLAFHPGTGRIAAGAYDGAVRIWDIKTGEIESSFVAVPLENSRILSKQTGGVEQSE